MTCSRRCDYSLKPHDRESDASAPSAEPWISTEDRDIRAVKSTLVPCVARSQAGKPLMLLRLRSCQKVLRKVVRVVI